MTVQDLEAEVLKLPAEDRARIAETLLASLPPSEEDEEDPIDGFGKSPVRGGSPEGNGARKREQPVGKRSIWGLGSSPVDCGVTDGSVNHDKYFYDVPDD
jgi:hypothetical protein